MSEPLLERLKALSAKWRDAAVWQFDQCADELDAVLWSWRRAVLSSLASPTYGNGLCACGHLSNDHACDHEASDRSCFKCECEAFRRPPANQHSKRRTS